MSPWQEHRSRTGCMLAFPLEERRLIGPHRNQWNSWPVAVQPKLNGERARFVDGFLLSSTEEPIYSVPHVLDALAALNPPFELDGELYRHGWTFEQIHSVVSRRVNLHSESELIEYHVFDSARPELTQLERIIELSSWFNKIASKLPKQIKLVETILVPDYPAVLNALETYVAANYEGIIVRNLDAKYERRRTANMLKFKPKQRDDYEILELLEEHDKLGNPKNRLGAVRLLAENGNIFNIYSGFDDNLRRELWRRRSELRGAKLTVYYQSLTTDRKVPSFGRVNSAELKLNWGIT